MIEEKYYFMNTDLDKRYATLWNGYLKYNKLDESSISFLDVDNILIDICNVNFYINIDNNNINLSLCQDENYYYYDFEKHIKKLIKKIEEICNLSIIYGEFNANELKHNGSQYRYTIQKDMDTDKVILKKDTLNWEKIKKRKLNCTRDEIEEDINNKFNKIKLK